MAEEVEMGGNEGESESLEENRSVWRTTRRYYDVHQRRNTKIKANLESQDDSVVFNELEKEQLRRRIDSKLNLRDQKEYALQSDGTRKHH